MQKLAIQGGTPLHGEVRISGAKNAALVAIRILALSDKGLLKKLDEHTRDQAEKVLNS